MKKLLIFIAVIVALALFLNDFLRSGKMENFFDSHPKPAFDSKIEYGVAFLADLANHKKSAEKRYKRIMEKYPDEYIAPYAWVDLIELYEENGDKDSELPLAKEFIEKYPNHEKTALIERKISIIEHGI